MPFPENAITDVLELYADSGNVKGVEHVLATYLTSMHVAFLSYQVTYIIFSLPN